MMTNFDAAKWCQDLLATDRLPTSMSTAMLNYVQAETIDTEIQTMASYIQLRDWADEIGLEYEEIALTALRSLAAVPQEGRMLISIFRYLQQTTGQTLTGEYFIEFFELGMFTQDAMVEAWNSQCEPEGRPELDKVDWAAIVVVLH